MSSCHVSGGCGVTCVGLATGLRTQAAMSGAGPLGRAVCHPHNGQRRECATSRPSAHPRSFEDLSRTRRDQEFQALEWSLGLVGARCRCNPPSPIGIPWVGRRPSELGGEDGTRRGSAAVLPA